MQNYWFKNCASEPFRSTYLLDLDHRIFVLFQRQMSEERNRELWELLTMFFPISQNTYSMSSDDTAQIQRTQAPMHEQIINESMI